MLALPDITGPVNTSSWSIEGVRPEVAAQTWRRVWPILQRAVNRFPAASQKWTPEYTLCAVECGWNQLWIAWSYDRRQIDGAVITGLIKSDDLPGKSICEIPLVAGDHLMEWGAPMVALLRAWAREQGCDYLVGYGRRGWKRLFGFAEHGLGSDGLPILAMPVREVPDGRR